MRNEKSGGRSGKGYYIALVLCAAAIGITSYVTRPSKDKQPDTPPLLQAESAETASSQQTQALEALATEAPEESLVPSSPPQQTQPEKRSGGAGIGLALIGAVLCFIGLGILIFCRPGKKGKYSR